MMVAFDYSDDSRKNEMDSGQKVFYSFESLVSANFLLVWVFKRFIIEDVKGKFLKSIQL